MSEIGRSLFLIGIMLAIAGAVMMLLGKDSFQIPRLPGDIVWRGKNKVVYFPLATCLLLSVVLSLLFWLLNRR